MRTFNVYHDDTFKAACRTMEQAKRYVANDSGGSADWALRYCGYNIKHGVAPKGQGGKV